MPAPVVRGSLRRVLLGGLTWPGGRTAPGGTAPGETPDHGLPVRDVRLIRESGYLKLAVPAHLGGEGLNLRQVACAQRRLAARAPGAALAVVAHHACVGAAADALASAPGDAAVPVAERLLSVAAQGRFFAGCGPDALGARPGDPREDTFAAGMFGWGLPLAGMTFYAIARQAFDLAAERAAAARRRRSRRRTARARSSARPVAGGRGGAAAGRHPRPAGRRHPRPAAAHRGRGRPHQP